MNEKIFGDGNAIYLCKNPCSQINLGTFFPRNVWDIINDLLAQRFWKSVFKILEKIYKE